MITAVIGTRMKMIPVILHEINIGKIKITKSTPPLTVSVSNHRFLSCGVGRLRIHKKLPRLKRLHATK